jgi:asparagine synthase (glutamine-hydrolysing)
MCGICGQYNFADDRPVAPTVIRAMARSIAHRGPDDEGYFVAGSLGLGFRRLSIIDLHGGHQPMSDAEQSTTLIFNGEIYNFAELRVELAARGHRFRTRSDTEVILHGYKEWGIGVLGRLDGMFGLAIWDAVRRKLVLARDAAGIKLVYYHVDRGSVLFGSEIRAILAALPAPPDVDMTALDLFLRYRYTPSPLTLHKGIRKLAPGTMAVFENGAWRVERWHRPATPRSSPAPSDAKAVRELFDIYTRALERHLVSDVPVGLLLSGGVDSALLLALMRRHGNGWPTYTVGYGNAVYKDDELADAARTAKLFSASNVPVQLSEDTFERSLPRIVSILEEPIAASSIVPMYHVCERARADVKVALVGQGPDELFGGYTRHLGIRYGHHWRAVPRALRSGIEAGIARLPRNEALRRGVYALDVQEPLRRYQNTFSIMPGDVVDGLFRDGVLPAGAGDAIRESWADLAPEMAGRGELGAFQVLEIRSSLPDELLMYADKLSMAHGLEVRVPYLDREVIEYATSLPAHLKIRLGRRKWLHRQVCRRFLPRSILARKKRGFAVNVVDGWFKRSLQGRMGSYLVDDQSLMYGFLEPGAVRRLAGEHRSGKRDNHKLLFSLVVLEEWLRSRATTRGAVTDDTEPRPVLAAHA